MCGELDFLRCRTWGTRICGGGGVDGEEGEFAVADLYRRLVFGRGEDDGVVEGDPGVAVDVDVAEADVVGVGDVDGVAEGLEAGDDAVAVEVGYGDVGGVVDGEGR